MTDIEEMGLRAKNAAKILRTADPETKTKALDMMADALSAHKDEILAANALDLEEAEKNGMAKAMMDRLLLTDDRIEGMASALRDVAAWPDPVGEVREDYTRPNGLRIRKVSIPLGVIGIIFESRPNVTSDCAGLCIRAGNCVILRGGHEAFRSNNAVTEVMRGALSEAGLPEDCVQLVKDLSHESAHELMCLSDYIDVLIPRGSARLINRVLDESRVPVIQTGAGNCHVYIDKGADPDMAVRITVNAKTDRPSVCNAAETLLVHEEIAEMILPRIADALTNKGVELRCDEHARGIIEKSGACSGERAALIRPAAEADWGTEYDDLIMAVKIVPSLGAAVDHIDRWSTHHSEAIVTEDPDAAEEFTAQVDSSCVYWNASTRFTDGGEMGLGAEIGISTQKLHARGPMGVDQLVTYKFILTGSGQVR
ncbi:MAG: glutamate-5-semialdehyde dehydrogenase [Eubacterium sp.]|nr:glutamate-5-semialdehyde dehydrogenase [Eubacterium sp.]